MRLVDEGVNETLADNRVKLYNMTQEWYYNLTTGQVEQGKQSRQLDRLGPYPDEVTARRALDIAKERNRIADEEDARDD